MAQFAFQVNQQALEDQRGNYDPIPAGWYTVIVDESEIRTNKAGSGQYVWMSFRVIDGEFNGRKVFTRFNVVNANPQAQEIGHRELSRLTAGVGLPGFTDTQELHGKPLQIKVKVRKDLSGRYPDDNEVSGFRSIAEAQGTGVAPAAPAAPAWAGAPQQPWAAAPAVAEAPVAAPVAPPPAAPAAPVAPMAPPAAPVPPAPPAAPPAAPAVPAAAGLPPWAHAKA